MRPPPGDRHALPTGSPQHPRGIRTRRACSNGTPTTRQCGVRDVIKRLEEIQSYAEAHEARGQHDGVACFTYLYHRITTRVLEGIESGRFDDGEFVNLLDVVFANRYLAALRASVLSPGDVPDAWEVLFQRRAEPHITRLQFAAAGVNAHVNFDLAVAVADTCTRLGSAPAIGEKHQSYQEINRIFAEEM